MIFIGLGSNRPGLAGSSFDMLANALRALEDREISVRTWSRLYRSDAYPDPSDPKFLNMVVEVSCSLTPHLLLSELHSIERQLGRRRKSRNEPRSIDLDLVDFRGMVFSDAALTLPHPRLSERAFVLAPLSEIRPNWRHPISKKTAFSLLQALGGRKTIQRLA